MTIASANDFSLVPFDAPLGAEVKGLDASQPMNAGTLEKLLDGWRKHLVLILRDQELSDRNLLDFSGHFGELDPPGPNPYGGAFLPDYPELNVISNLVDDGKPIGNLGDGEAVWHADMTYVDVPPKAGILYALEVPPEGGDTFFSDMFAAYEALSPSLKERIEGKVAIHDAAHNSAGMLRKGYEEIVDVRETPGARHPLVRTDPATGRRCLFLGRRPNAYILGLEVQESEALLDELWEHAQQPHFAMRQQWRAGDLLMWLNLCVLHRREAFDPASRRVMHRAQIKGEELIA